MARNERKSASEKTFVIVKPPPPSVSIHDCAPGRTDADMAAGGRGRAGLAFGALCWLHQRERARDGVALYTTLAAPVGAPDCAGTCRHRLPHPSLVGSPGRRRQLLAAAGAGSRPPSRPDDPDPPHADPPPPPHPYWAGSPDRGGLRRGVDVTSRAWAALGPSDRVRAILLHGVRPNGHHPRHPCSACFPTGNGRGVMECSACAGEGVRPAAPGGAGRSFFVDPVRCPRCRGVGQAWVVGGAGRGERALIDSYSNHLSPLPCPLRCVPCPVCAAQEGAGLRPPDPYGIAWTHRPAPGSRAHPYFEDDARAWGDAETGPDGGPPLPPRPAPRRPAGGASVLDGWCPEDGFDGLATFGIPAPRISRLYRRPRDWRPGMAMHFPYPLRARAEEDCENR